MKDIVGNNKQNILLIIVIVLAAWNIFTTNGIKTDVESYKNKMDKFLDELKSSGTKIDGQRFLTQVRNQTNQIYWEVDETSDSTPKRFSEFQLELFKHFRDKLK